MSYSDRVPLRGTPVTNRIVSRSNNRLGAVYSSLYAFWQARHSAGATAGANNRRDAYTIILFDHEVSTVLQHDFTSTPDALLNVVLAHAARGGTDYTRALNEAQRQMETHWSTERCVVRFLAEPLLRSCFNEKKSGHHLLV